MPSPLIQISKQNFPMSICGMFIQTCRPGLSLISPFSLLYNAVTFKEMGNFKNICRVDPRNISSGVGSASYYHGASGGNVPIIFTAVVKIRTCEVFEPVRASSNDKVSKHILGFMLQGEFSRDVCLHGNVSDWTGYNAPIGYGSHQFSTMYKAPEGISLCSLHWKTRTDVFIF